MTAMRRARWITGSLSLALLLGACGQAASQGTDGPGPFTNADGYVDISVDRLAEMMENKDFTLVNVHIPYEGEIPQTDLFIPFNQIADHQGELSARDAPIVLYCRSGNMSTTAAKVLADEGYTNVMEVDGGFRAWQSAGYELLNESR